MADTPFITRQNNSVSSGSLNATRTVSRTSDKNQVIQPSGVNAAISFSVSADWKDGDEFYIYNIDPTAGSRTVAINADLGGTTTISHLEHARCVYDDTTSQWVVGK